MAIETKDLRFSYDKSRRVLDGLSFTARTGRITYIAGKNGAGKTTWLRTACELLPARRREGAVLFDGQEFSKVRSRVCVVFDTPPIYSRLNGYDNLYILYQIDGRSERAQRVLERMGLFDMMLRHKAGSLSLGQRHRFGIAASLLVDADYYILDEPDIGLDPEGIEAIIELLTELKNKGRTIVVTGQNFDLYERLADDIAVLHNGRCLCEDEVGQFMDTYCENANERHLKAAYERAVKKDGLADN